MSDAPLCKDCRFCLVREMKVPTTWMSFFKPRTEIMTLCINPKVEPSAHSRVDGNVNLVAVPDCDEARRNPFMCARDGARFEPTT